MKYLSTVESITTFLEIKLKQGIIPLKSISVIKIISTFILYIVIVKTKLHHHSLIEMFQEHVLSNRPA